MMNLTTPGNPTEQKAPDDAVGFYRFQRLQRIAHRDESQILQETSGNSRGPL